MSEPATQPNAANATAADAAPAIPPAAPPAFVPQQVRLLHGINLERGLLACKFDPTGKYIVAGGMNSRLSQLEVNWETPAKPLHIGGHQSWVAALAFSPDGARLFSADYTGLVHCWPFPLVEPPQAVWSKQAHQGWIRTVAVSPDGTLLATGGNDMLVKLWSVTDGAPVAELKGHDCDVYSLAFHPDGKSLVSGDLKGIVKQWDVASHAQVRELDAKLMFVQQDNIRLGGVRSMKFDTSGKTLVCAGMSGFGSIGDGIGAATVLLFDWEQGRQTHYLLPKESTRSFSNGVAFFPDDTLMAATGGLDRGFLMFWKPGPANPLPEPPASPPANANANANAAAATTAPPAAKTPPTEPKRVETFFRFAMPESGWAMDLHPDGKHFAVAHHDNQLRYFDFG